jgi:hypothetical protein
MLKQTLFVIISVCAISNLQCGCFHSSFWVDSGNQSPQATARPYFADFPGVQHVSSSPVHAVQTAQRRLSNAFAMISVSQPVADEASKDKSEKPAPKTVEVKN